jgi:phage tail-like protein
MPEGMRDREGVTATSFGLTVDGVEIGQFAELGGIISEAELPDLTGRLLQKLPGKRKPPTVTLRRGLTTDMGVFAWHQSVMEGRLDEARKSATLTIFDSTGNAVARYHLENAWPSKVEISTLKAGASEVLYETVTLMGDSLQRISP